MMLYLIIAALFMLYAIASSIYTIASLKIVTDRSDELTFSERAVHSVGTKLHS